MKLDALLLLSWFCNSVITTIMTLSGWNWSPQVGPHKLNKLQFSLINIFKMHKNQLSPSELQMELKFLPTFSLLLPRFVNPYFGSCSTFTSFHRTSVKRLSFSNEKTSCVFFIPHYLYPTPTSGRM